MFSNFRFMIVIGMVSTFLLFSGASIAQHQWTSLDGPYWANGIDVAYGMSGSGQASHRYLIGDDGNTKKLFYWRTIDPYWFEWDELQTANKLISYKNAGSGHVAVCSAYDDDIFSTVNGGVFWDPRGFPSNFNRHFSSVEIVNPEQNPGNTIFVGCEPNETLATTYYTTDAGANWARLGGDEQTDPIYGLHIYDIESVQSSFLTAGTDEGLYRHDAGNYGSIWEYVAFAGLDVKALETVDLQDDEQLAAVFDDPDWSLHYTDDGWASHQEVLINGESFNKEVHDIAGIGWDDPAEPKTFYLATSEGLFLLKFKGNLQDVYLYDLGNAPNFGYDPLRYDNNITSVDYYFYEEGNYKHAKILASTAHNVYEIHETRDIGLILDIFSVEFAEVVTGTYLCNVVGISFPENDLDDRQIFTVTENALVKNYDDAAWALTGSAFTGSGII